jgi:hypothetical protein
MCTGAKCEGISGYPPVLSKPGYWQGAPAKCFLNQSVAQNQTEAVLTLTYPEDCHQASAEWQQEDANATMKYVKVARIYRCHPSEACIDYNESKALEEAMCRDGHTGVACSECQDGWQVFAACPTAYV